MHVYPLHVTWMAWMPRVCSDKQAMQVWGMHAITSSHSILSQSGRRGCGETMARWAGPQRITSPCNSSPAPRPPQSAMRANCSARSSCSAAAVGVCTHARTNTAHWRLQKRWFGHDDTGNVACMSRRRWFYDHTCVPPWVGGPAPAARAAVAAATCWRVCSASVDCVCSPA